MELPNSQEDQPNEHLPVRPETARTLMDLVISHAKTGEPIHDGEDFPSSYAKTIPLPEGEQLELTWLPPVPSAGFGDEVENYPQDTDSRYGVRS